MHPVQSELFPVWSQLLPVAPSKSQLLPVGLSVGGPASPAHSWQPSWPRRLRKSCSWAQRLRSRVAPQRAGDGTSSTHDWGLSKYWGLGTGTRGQGQEGNGTRGHWGYTGTWGIQVAKRHWGTLGRGGVQGYRDVEGHGGCGHVGMWGVMGTLGHGVTRTWGHGDRRDSLGS